MGNFDGFRAALEALRGLDTKAQNRILEEIVHRDPQLAERLKNGLRTFEDLRFANPQGLLKLFQEIKDVTWVVALRNQKQDFVEALIKPLANRRAELIRAAVAKLGPQPLSKVHEAQRVVLKLALEMESRGELLFKKDNDPLV